MWLTYCGDMEIKLLEIKELSKLYESSNRVNVQALNSISVDFDSAGIVFIVGKNGSGKSTFLNLIGAMNKPTSGSIIVDGKNINKQKKVIQ